MITRLILISLFISCKLFAQDFKWSAAVDSVSTEGYYNIQLQPEITNRLNTAEGDIRIFDENQNEISYLYNREIPAESKVEFINYEILKNEYVSGCCTNIILRNGKKTKIDNIVFVIKNSDVSKRARLSGSNNNSDWYIIKEDYLLQSVFNNSETSEYKLLNFPLSDYEYYRVEISDYRSRPINITSAGYYDSYSEKGKYSELPSTVFTQKDSSDKYSYLKITFPDSVLIDKISFEIEEPELFLRKAYFREKRLIKVKRRTEKEVWDNVKEIEFNSAYPNAFFIPGYKIKELTLVISNEDNLPLNIKTITGFQLNRSLTAKLKSGEKYLLKFGNNKVAHANYDLVHFKDKIPADINSIGIGEILDHRRVGKVLDSGSFFTNKIYIWLAIILVIALLGFMTMKMLKEMKADDN